MATIAPTVLQPLVIRGIISRLKVNNTRMQDFFGAGLDGGSAIETQSGRRFAYDIFDMSREVAQGRLPGSPAKRIARHPVGNVTGTFPRVSEAVNLSGEEVHNMRRIGGPGAELDVNGSSFIQQQLGISKQRVVNHREFQLWAMLRGSYTYNQDGDDVDTGFSGGGITIDFQVPAGNKSKLDMLGDGDIIATAWDDAAAPIIGDLHAIHAAFESLCGLGLNHVWMNSTTWAFIVANTEVKAIAGTANRPFEVLTKTDDNDFTAVLAGAPWVTFHISNAVLNLDGTVTKMIDDTHAIFCPTPDPSWISYLEGSEPVADGPNMPWVERFGAHFHAKMVDDPAGADLHSVHNGIPMLKVPKAMAYGLIDY